MESWSILPSAIICQSTAEFRDNMKQLLPHNHSSVENRALEDVLLVSKMVIYKMIIFHFHDWRKNIFHLPLLFVFSPVCNLIVPFCEWQIPGDKTSALYTLKVYFLPSKTAGDIRIFRLTSITPVCDTTGFRSIALLFSCPKLRSYLVIPHLGLVQIYPWLPFWLLGVYSDMEVIMVFSFSSPRVVFSTPSKWPNYLHGLFIWGHPGHLLTSSGGVLTPRIYGQKPTLQDGDRVGRVDPRPSLKELCTFPKRNRSWVDFAKSVGVNECLFKHFGEMHLFHLWVIWIFTTWSLQPHNFRNHQKQGVLQ